MFCLYQAKELDIWMRLILGRRNWSRLELHCEVWLMSRRRVEYFHILFEHTRCALGHIGKVHWKLKYPGCSRRQGRLWSYKSEKAMLSSRAGLGCGREIDCESLFVKVRLEEVSLGAWLWIENGAESSSVLCTYRSFFQSKWEEASWYVRSCDCWT